MDSGNNSLHRMVTGSVMHRGRCHLRIFSFKNKGWGKRILVKVKAFVNIWTKLMKIVTKGFSGMQIMNLDSVLPFL